MPVLTNRILGYVACFSLPWFVSIPPSELSKGSAWMFVIGAEAIGCLVTYPFTMAFLRARTIARDTIVWEPPSHRSNPLDWNRPLGAVHATGYSLLSFGVGQALAVSAMESRSLGPGLVVAIGSLVQFVLLLAVIAAKTANFGQQCLRRLYRIVELWPSGEEGPSVELRSMLSDAFDELDLVHRVSRISRVVRVEQSEPNVVEIDFEDEQEWTHRACFRIGEAAIVLSSLKFQCPACIGTGVNNDESCTLCDGLGWGAGA